MTDTQHLAPPNTDIVGTCADYTQKLDMHNAWAFSHIWSAGSTGTFEHDLTEAVQHLEAFIACPDPFPTEFTHLVYRTTYNEHTLVTPRAHCLELLCSGTERAARAVIHILNNFLPADENTPPLHSADLFDVRSIA